MFKFLEQPSQRPFRSWVRCTVLLQRSSIDRVPKIFVKLVKVNLKDAACLGKLIGEGFPVFVERKNALLKLSGACCLVESVVSQEVGLIFDKLTEVIEVVTNLLSEPCYRVEERDSKSIFSHKEGVPTFSKIRRQRLIRSGVRPCPKELEI